MKFSFLIFAPLVSITAAASRNLVADSEGVACLDEFVDLSFARSTLTINNLGNQGPEFDKEPIMLFEGVGEYDAKTLDLQISIKDGFNYILTNNKNNGVLCHSTSGNPDTESCNNQVDFGQVNLAGHDQETTLVFQIKDHATGEPVVLPGFAFSNFDIDHGVKERYVIQGWSNALYDRNNTEAYFSEDEAGWCDGTEKCLYAFSTHSGWGCDNPIDPNDLGITYCNGATNPVNRKLRSFMVEFENTSSWEVYFATVGGVANWGRNVVFAFNSGWEYDCPNENKRHFIDGSKAGGSGDGDEKSGGGGGDPHFQRWGREHSSFHGECDLVMTHSDSFHNNAGLDLHVRTKIDTYFCYIETAALRIGDDILQFHRENVIFNGVALSVPDLPFTFGDNFKYTVKEGQVEAGKNVNFYQYFQVSLHGDSSILFKFYKKYLTIDIKGHTNDFAGSSGLLGDYHTGEMIGRGGQLFNDFKSFGFEWQVNQDDPVIFAVDRSPQLPYERCRMPTMPRPSRRKLRGKDSALMQSAKDACIAASDVDLCLEDVLMTGDLGIAGLW